MLKIPTHAAKLVLLLLACNSYLFSFADESTNFIHLSAIVDRQQTKVTNVVEDSLGYLWLNSNSGLLRYDGYDYRQYSFNEIFGDNVSFAKILGISKDSDGDIWCVSQKGAISKLMPSGKFESQYSNYTKLPEHLELESLSIGKSRLWMGSNFGTAIGQSLKDSTSVRFDIYSSNETITSIAEGKNDIVWFSTNKGRIFKGNTSTMDLYELKGPFNNPFNTVILTTDKNGNLWIGTDLTGFYFYDLKTETYEHFHNKAKASHFVPTNMVIRIFRDSKGLIWLGTDGGGLYQIKPKTKHVKIYNYSKSNKFSLQSNSVIGIGETNNNDIWVFTNYGNINILPSESSTVGYYSGNISGVPTRILSILKCQNGNLWAGTDGEGLTIINKKGNAVKQFVAKTNTANGLTGNYIQAMVEDRNQNKWIGTYLNGLSFYNSKTSTFSSIKVLNSKGQLGSDIRSLFIDNSDQVWVGSNIGISLFSLSGNQLAFFPRNKNGLKGNITEVFLQDENDQIWIGMSEGGLFLFKEGKTIEDSSFIPYQLIDSKNPAENSIFHGAADYHGHLYFTNSYSRLLKFNIKEKKTVPINGFSNEEIHGVTAILVSDSSNLWVSRSNGISHLDLNAKQDYLYTWKNGTIKGAFLSGSATKDKNNLFYFGGVDGLNFFDPKQMKTSQKQFQLRVNQIKVVNRDANKIIPEQLSEGIEHLKSIELNHKQTSFSFQFSVINDHLDPNYFYAYRLKGFDKNWIITENQRIATYTSIPYGDYTFEVKAGTNRNLWDIEPRSIQVTVLSPLWQRWWAYVIYSLALIIALFFIIRYSIMWARLKKKLLLEEWQNEKNNELYAMKMNFFAKMSHEIQTPLTLIMAPIESMIERAEGNLLLKQRLNVIHNNAKRLSRIALELMTVRNRELGKLQLRANQNNISKHCESIALSFTEQARFKHIDFVYESKQDDIILWYDKEKLEHVIYNLLSNAFKFTPREGQIQFKIKSNCEHFFLSISDSGIGIDEENLKHIFNMFYQSKEGRAVGGTGIGLALSKELMTLHRGKIMVDSTLNQGTKFTLILPLGNKHLKTEEIINNKPLEAIRQDDSLNKEDLNTPSVNSNSKIHLLIVEDNYEMLLLLKDTFSPFYNVFTAENGKEALAILHETTPDIIISDIMMPIMDGITLCKQLKNTKTMRHIPIILLTARNTTQSKLEGLKYGAIEYINKPFNVKELIFKVNNILESHKNLILKYRTELLTQSEAPQVESPDEKFIESVLIELEKNLVNPDFKLEDLSEALSMSYSNIYRRFQSITNKTLVDFMRCLRLKKAAFILVKHNYTISEIAFNVGFNDPKYFSRCFKKEYNYTPKEFKQLANSDGGADFLKHHDIIKE
ncbi:response regulator [Ancylomarina euxinus]|uniref:histidine kinase n=1 Tax=Ancylomarina euxinus TaxID=2283627 RepID=A0A425XX34_9BACT|nr:ATP-binding protein [Ancylomarina euxinus]MCZ4696204.1 ATP-binding protein [Ancylomarina euxinus]MUP16432.1 response regulator [Ancylomarina euxinus]RRG19222.1 response regulator [Ancylomarina euxinus]